jgi:hypothetical protein
MEKVVYKWQLPRLALLIFWVYDGLKSTQENEYTEEKLKRVQVLLFRFV